MANQYNLENIRTLLIEGFDDRELRRLCFEVRDFRPIYDNLAAGTGKSEIAQQLLEYVEQKKLFETLLNEVKKRNPARYNQDLPYLIEPAPSNDDQSKPEAPKIRKLSQTINLFNQGCLAFEQAVQALAEKNFAKYETELVVAAKNVPDALEWALKIYLRNLPRLAPEDRPKLKEPSFHELMILMEKYADPPLDRATVNQLYGYRDLRNESGHHGAIPPIEEVREAIAGVRRFMLAYLRVEEKDVSVYGMNSREGSGPKMPPKEQVPTRNERLIILLENEFKELQEPHNLLSELISRLRKDLVIATNPADKFRLEKQIEQAEAERHDYRQKMAAIEAQIEQLRR